MRHMRVHQLDECEARFLADCPLLCCTVFSMRCFIVLTWIDYQPRSEVMYVPRLFKLLTAQTHYLRFHAGTAPSFAIESLFSALDIDL